MVILNRKFLKYMFLGLWFLACNNRTQKSAERNPQEFSTAPATMKEEKPRPPVPATAPDPGNMPDQVAPGSCRIVGKVIAIKPELEPDKTTPCGKVPCKAVIKIMKVVAYGAAFQPLLAEGREVQVYFAFTLSPSAAYFPDLATSLPGLKVGSIFQADLKNPAEGSADKPTTYLVYTYVLI